MFPKMLKKKIFSADGDGGLRVCVGGGGVGVGPNDPYTSYMPDFSDPYCEIRANLP